MTYAVSLLCVLLWAVQVSQFCPCLSLPPVIFPGSDAAREVSKADMLKRTKAYAEKKAKLSKSHYYVSKTRLCVRNLPTSVDERKLKALFQQSASASATVVQVLNYTIYYNILSKILLGVYTPPPPPPSKFILETLILGGGGTKRFIPPGPSFKNKFGSSVD